jgi:hypothetical protein
MNYSAYIRLDAHKATLRSPLPRLDATAKFASSGKSPTVPMPSQRCSRSWPSDMPNCTSCTRPAPVDTGSTAKLLRRATPARSSRPLTRRAALAIASRLTGATRSCWLGYRAQAS